MSTATDAGNSDADDDAGVVGDADDAMMMVMMIMMLMVMFKKLVLKVVMVRATSKSQSFVA